MHETDTEQDQGDSDDDASLFTNRNENLIESEGENEDDWSKDDVGINLQEFQTLLNSFWFLGNYSHSQSIKIF